MWTRRFGFGLRWHHQVAEPIGRRVHISRDYAGVAQSWLLEGTDSQNHERKHHAGVQSGGEGEPGDGRAEVRKYFTTEDAESAEKDKDMSWFSLGTPRPQR